MQQIHVLDEFSPEDIAMAQALYSRSPESVLINAEKMRKAGSGKFMSQFYVGYGHQSIGDCGSTTIFIEDVSMLVAKAIQDWQLYSGQETSSRYIDMSKRMIVDPVGTKESAEILQKWMSFYTQAQPAVEAHLREKYPREPAEDEKVYDKAIKVRVFDIMRGFLPAGCTTQLSWHTNLRQAHDHLALLAHHPLEEVRVVASQILDKLKEKYPASFSHKIYDEQEAYRAKMAERYTYYGGSIPALNGYDNFGGETSIDPREFAQYQLSEIVRDRPVKTELPSFLEELGSVSFKFLLDFGSFRDIQRHRHGVCRMPMLLTSHVMGFNSWYLEQLPSDVCNRAKELIDEQVEAVSELDTSLEVKQYYAAMGFNVACKVTYGLPAAVYVIELRSGKLIHPTLRKVVHQMYKYMEKKFPGIVRHVDLEKDDWDIRRGLQDITKK